MYCYIHGDWNHCYCSLVVAWVFIISILTIRFCTYIRIMKSVEEIWIVCLILLSLFITAMLKKHLCPLTFSMKSIYSLEITGKQSLYTGKSVYFMGNKGIGKNNLCCTYVLNISVIRGSSTVNERVCFIKVIWSKA